MRKSGINSYFKNQLKFVQGLFVFSLCATVLTVLSKFNVITLNDSVIPPWCFAIPTAIICVVLITKLDKITHWTCPNCNKSMLIKLDWTCPFCHKKQGEVRIIRDDCIHCKREIESFFCEHCHEEIKL